MAQVKVHVLLDHGDYMHSFLHITEARMHDSKAAPLLSLPAGSIIALDRAYMDFDLVSNLSNLSSENFAVTGSGFLFQFILDSCGK